VPPAPPPATTKYSIVKIFADGISVILAAELSLLVEPLLLVPSLKPIR
jgi:hypothetical protein